MKYKINVTYAYHKYHTQLCSWCYDHFGKYVYDWQFINEIGSDDNTSIIYLATDKKQTYDLFCSLFDGDFITNPKFKYYIPLETFEGNKFNCIPYSSVFDWCSKAGIGDECDAWQIYYPELSTGIYNRMATFKYQNDLILFKIAWI